MNHQLYRYISCFIILSVLFYVYPATTTTTTILKGLYILQLSLYNIILYYCMVS